MTTLLRVLAAIALDLLEAAAYFAAVALLTFLLSLVLPVVAALVVALVGVSVCFGYRRALQWERARERGEYR